MTTRPTPLPFAYGKRPEDLEVLARSSLLRGMHIKEVSTLLELLDQVALAPGACVFREGDEGDAMYFVLEGEARLRRGQLELRPVGPGDHFGELALLAGRARAASVLAYTDMRLARLSRARYLSFAANHPASALHFTQGLASALGDELVAMTDSVGLLAYQRSLPRQIEVRVRREGEGDLFVPTGTLAGTLLPRERAGALVVAAQLNKKAASLEAAIVASLDIDVLTLADMEGRAIFRRSAALALLEAARRAGPALSGAQVRMGSPLESGQVVHLEPLPAPAAEPAVLDALARALAGVIAEDLPLREEVWQLDEARAELERRGWADAAASLPSRRETTVTLATCGETFALGLGPLVPRGSYLEGLSLEPHPAGLLLRLGARVEREMPLHRGARVDPLATEGRAPRYGGEMTASARRWLQGLGVESVGRYNELCVSASVDEVIRVAEGFHEKWIGRVADAVASRADRVKIIAIAGPSSSGKTTFIKRLTTQLRVNGLRPRALSLDDYYVDRARTVRDERGEYDFEAFEALDSTLLQDQLTRLMRGERVRTAKYDFVLGKSLPEGGAELWLEKEDVLLLEGIHGLNPALVGAAVPEGARFGIFVHPATTLAFDRASVFAPDDLRLLRRIVRDRHSRNYTAADTIARWPSVRRGELCHIYPTLPQADVVFDSALVYEPSVLKTYAERYLLEVPPSHPAFTTAFRLRNLIDQFVAIYPDHVPPTSVIREFIGGSGFEY
ncbi:MAG TPA: cyclic nucleotide-binding domain-containing protein [Polyangiaceae bacterium]|nr:cyclic nucleotide-binding domain-containing protein [Polyangiaceae bacterium]